MLARCNKPNLLVLRIVVVLLLDAPVQEIPGLVVEEENFDDAQASRFSSWNARATNQNLKSDDREEFVNGCVERGEVSDDLWGSYQACFARADELKLAGGDRRDFVNWCVDRGNSYNASYSDRYRDCDSRARSRKLTGKDRRDFLDWCADASQAYQREYDTYWDRDRRLHPRRRAQAQGRCTPRLPAEVPRAVSRETIGATRLRSTGGAFHSRQADSGRSESLADDRVRPGADNPSCRDCRSIIMACMHVHATRLRIP